ncbi:GDSL-type esterase/lipase family protein [Ruminococcaceae bacterium OttesenSCG-928-D13]|nr:GDSL-type esterase/lipase family protein [Ruminococcaceae bacterium OttesenSCG-928-D13]
MDNRDNRNNKSSGPAPGGDYAYRDAGTPAGRQPAPPRKRRMKKSARRAVALVTAVVVMLALAWGITSLIERGHQDGDVVDPASAPSGAAQPVSLPEVVEPDDAPLQSLPPVDNTGWNFVGPLEQQEPLQVLSPSARMIALPENGRVDMKFFDTTVFVGDSITQGLELYSSGIPNAKYCAYRGASPRSMYSGETIRKTPSDTNPEVPLDKLVEYQPDNVYILMGTNAMVSMDDEPLLEYYAGMIDAFKAALDPAVTFYIQSITPVVQGVDSRFSLDRINSLNDQLAKMALEKGCYYIDLHEALAGDDGWLRPDYGAGDGYHMTPVGYAAWVEYLVTHTAYHRRHAHLYLEGSHYYEQAALPAG